MSVEAMAWAFKQKIKDAQTKLVLLALCDHADEDGYCWPSQQRLAEKAACSDDTAARRLHVLEKLGFIVRRRRARQTTIYRITLYKTAMKPQDVRNHAFVPTKAQKDEMLNPQTAVDDTAAGAVLTINVEPSIEPSFFAPSDAKPERPAPEAKPSRRAKRHPMPQDWEPDDDGFVFAKDKGFSDQRIRQLIIACRDYHLRNGTMIAGPVGLAATWRTWCNNEVKFTEERQQRYGNRNNGSRETRGETILAASREFAAEMARDRAGEEIFERGTPAVDQRGTVEYYPPDRRH